MRALPPKSPEKTLKGLAMSAQQRAELVEFMQEFPKMKRAVEVGLRSVSWPPKERLKRVTQAKAAIGDLTLALDASFRHDLFYAAKIKAEEEQIHKFLKLLPMMAQLTDRISPPSIRERWAGSDRRSARKAWTSIETNLVRGFVRRVGFRVDPPDLAALEVLQRILSFTSQTALGVSAIRKRIAADDKRVAAEAKRDAEDGRIAAGGKLSTSALLYFFHSDPRIFLRRLDPVCVRERWFLAL
jgi:hypothetical protein